MLTRKGRGSASSSSGLTDMDSIGSVDSMGSDAFDAGGGMDSQSQLDSFAKEVLNALNFDSMPPFPNYYQLYFEKMLDEKPYEFKKSITELLETESNSEDEKRYPRAVACCLFEKLYFGN